MKNSYKSLISEKVPPTLLLRVSGVSLPRPGPSPPPPSQQPPASLSLRSRQCGWARMSNLSLAEVGSKCPLLASGPWGGSGEGKGEVGRDVKLGPGPAPPCWVSHRGPRVKDQSIQCAEDWTQVRPPLDGEGGCDI